MFDELGEGKGILHDDQVHKVDTRCCVEDAGLGVEIHVRRQGAETEPLVAESEALTLAVPVTDGEGEHGFQHAEKAVGLDD